jgi:hypothetical protein
VQTLNSNPSIGKTNKKCILQNAYIAYLNIPCTKELFRYCQCTLKGHNSEPNQMPGIHSWRNMIKRVSHSNKELEGPSKSTYCAVVRDEHTEAQGGQGACPRPYHQLI